MTILRTIITSLPLLAGVNGHLSMWSTSMFGLDPTNINSDNASQPLQDYTFNQWWWHGALDLPPADGEVFELKPNSTVEVMISSNKGHTPLGHGWYDENPREAPNPWTNTNGWGNMHAPSRLDVAGSALAIAYKSTSHTVMPADFVVFSVKYDSPARQLETFAVPDLPACPNNRCMCAWFWIHASAGGTDQMYMTPFVCNVTGATNTRKLGRPAAPWKCENNATEGCMTGAKQPMYWMNREGMNMFEPGHYAPTYAEPLYGFADGAQTDIWEDGRNATQAEEVEKADDFQVPAVPASTLVTFRTAVSTVARTATTTPTVASCNARGSQQYARRKGRTFF